MHAKVAATLKYHHVPHRVRRHADLATPIKSPVDFAAALGYPVGRIAKALLVREKGRTRPRYGLAVCSAHRRVDLLALAEAMDVKRLEMASREELRRLTGYPPTGVSPLGLEGIQIFLDEDLFAFPTILVGAGAVGVEVELDPKILCQVSQAEVIHLTDGGPRN